RVDALLMLAVLDGRKHRVDVLHEIPRLGIEQHVLLLDAERVRIALAERVVEHAGVSGAQSLGALPGDRRREDLLHTPKYVAVRIASLTRSPLRLRSRQASAGRAAR